MADPSVQNGQERRVLTVSELTTRIKENLESAFPSVYVVGELSRVTRAASGHLYMTIKDENAVLNAVMWRGLASALKFKPEEGLETVVHGSIDVYPPRGSYQLIVSWMEPKGMGALQLAFRQLMEKLEKEGLFREEIKKPLPPFPRKIGVVTSPTGAAIRDIINVISRRLPTVELYLFPSRVQGAEAAAEIAGAMDLLNEKRPDLDLIIIGRGGGSLEDLWPFNEEIVARAIHRSRIPIVSAVGHEIDFSISDFAADVRAATPTEAAEIVVPDRVDILRRLNEHRKRLTLTLGTVVDRGRQLLRSVTSRYAFRRPEAAVRERAQKLDDIVEKVKTSFAHRLGVLREEAAAMGRRLDALSPLRVLERGYSVTLTSDGRILRSVERVSRGDRITSKLHRGEILSKVVELNEPPKGGTKDNASEE
ncbi:MAG: exodeoxyribonuclease VII large subunit [Candidatus Brocadiae bacterium]|nr:exodeoxyribonuclease VII large subunit [Candidatus Brocadiia bacterium]